MTPQFAQDNISYHDCAEESYHIWGTSWMMQFGELPTGGYFWRPPYINHGSFRCKYGTIALGRTDSKLHNYFHYNPWTNPQDNLRRAAAQTLPSAAAAPPVAGVRRPQSSARPAGLPAAALPRRRARA